MEISEFVITISSEGIRNEVRMPWDSDCTSVAAQLANMLRGMSFMTTSVVEAFRNVADDLEEEMRLYVNQPDEIIEDGTTN